MKKKCPICSKALKFNYDKKRFECPKKKTGRDKKYGCGYVHIPLESSATHFRKVY